MKAWGNQKPMPESRVSTRRVQVVGHRGASGSAPENTLAAFQRAVDLKIDGVEFDVQRSADGHLIVFHDDDMQRLTRQDGIVAQMTLAELQSFDVGGHFSGPFQGERILTLEAFFDFMRANDLLMFLEMKDPFRFPGLEAQVAGMIRRFDFIERVQVRSFFHNALHTFHEIAPEIAVSELWFNAVPEDDETHFRTIDVYYPFFTADNIQGIHARGQKATAWTVNDLETARNLIDWGIDGITTDYPERILELL